MDPARIFQIITNSTLLATRLLTGDATGGPLSFTQARYCVVVAEDAAPSASLATVRAVHKQGAEVRYTLTQGNRQGLFSVSHASGTITLQAPLDYEAADKHEFVVRGEGGGSAAHALVRVLVADVNDNPPVFVRPEPHVTVIEEDDRDLPLPLAKVDAQDVDEVDAGRLHYSISGDGVDGLSPSDAYFTVDAGTGEVTQRKALDRDPPSGRGVWRVKVTVRDGQSGSRDAAKSMHDSPDSPFALIPTRRLPRAAGIHGEVSEAKEEEKEGEEGSTGGLHSAESVIEVTTILPLVDADVQEEEKGRRSSSRSSSSSHFRSRIISNSTSSCCGSGRSGSDNGGRSNSLCNTSNNSSSSNSSHNQLPSPKHLRLTKDMATTTTTVTTTTTTTTVTTATTTAATTTGDGGRGGGGGGGALLHDLMESQPRSQFVGNQEETDDQKDQKRPSGTKSEREKPRSLSPYRAGWWRKKRRKRGERRVIGKEENEERNEESEVGDQESSPTQLLILLPDEEESVAERTEELESEKEGERNGESEEERRRMSPSRLLPEGGGGGRGGGGAADGSVILDSPARRLRNSYVTTRHNTIGTRLEGHSTLDNPRLQERLTATTTTTTTKTQVLSDRPPPTSHLVPSSSPPAPLSSSDMEGKRTEGRDGHGWRLRGGREDGMSWLASGDGWRSRSSSRRGEESVKRSGKLPRTGEKVSDVQRTRGERGEVKNASTFTITNSTSAFSPSSSSSYSSSLTKRQRFTNTNNTSNTATSITTTSKREREETGEVARRKSGRRIYIRRYLNLPTKTLGTHLTLRAYPHLYSLSHPPQASKQALLHLPDSASTSHMKRRRSTRRGSGSWKTQQRRFLGGVGDRASSREVQLEELKNFHAAKNEDDGNGDKEDEGGEDKDEEEKEEEEEEHLQPPTTSVIENSKSSSPSVIPASTGPLKTYTHIKTTSSSVSTTTNTTSSTTTTTSSLTIPSPSSSFPQELNLISKKETTIQRPSQKTSKDRHLSPSAPRGRHSTRREIRDLETSLYTMTEARQEGDSYGECVYYTPTTPSSTAPPGEDGKKRGVHAAETVLTVVVKDINDNAPVFPNITIFGQVMENGAANLSVAVVSAWDADDASEGTNAKLTYSIEKNVIDERTGEAIFAVHPETGLVRTALCCLDRETTPEYNIQVVATDGGGQKGTGTVVIRLSDVNDNSPRLARKQWDLTVQETWGDRQPENTTLLEIAAADRDTANYFYYRVMEESGWGWEHFRVRTVGAVGQLYPVKTLDYENERHRQGFKFMVQVTDRGRGGWTDPRHLDTAWISVTLRDVNDNPPAFPRPHAHVTVREDATTGTLLATLPARDPDMAGQQKVDYWVEGGWGALKVDEEGGVSLWRALDREAPGGSAGEALVVAVDRGRPPLTATATLSITVTDVNDCAPTLLPPTVFHVVEDAPPTLLGVLKATDEDVWALGHGPPFNLSLADTNPEHVLDSVTLKFDPRLDSGRGGAELWTTGGLDREAWSALRVDVVVADAGGLASTHTLTVIVDDLNDHPMKPAAKTVYLWKTQGGGGSEAPLGRVYVEDPDDWDAADKSYAWDGPAHPLFSLHPRHGTVFASSVVREGRYSLRFRVSDKAWGQRGVAANVTVVVRELSPDALTHATPLTLTPTTPARLTKGWTPSGGGGVLGKLLQEVLKVVGDRNTSGQRNKVEVVSVYGGHSPYHHHSHHHHDHHYYYSDTTTSITTNNNNNQHLHQPRKPHHNYHNYYHYYNNKNNRKGGTDINGSSQSGSEEEGTRGGEGEKGEDKDSAGLPPPPPSACVWLSVMGSDGAFLNPVKLQGLLGLHVRKLEEATKLRVDLESPEEAGRRLEDTESSPLSGHHQPGDPSSAASLASTALPLQVVDTNATSLVTPRLSRALSCRAHEPETCTPSSCLNGGRCLPHSSGNRCVCPGGAEGWQCKVLSRTFRGSGWAWVPPLPRCLPTTVSLRLLTRNPHALLLYAGPMAPTQRPEDTVPTPMLALQLRNGRPQLLVEGSVEPMKVEVNVTLTDGEWHDLHVHLDAQGAALMVDRCGRGWEHGADTPAHCLARIPWVGPWGLEAWPGSGPLQVGGFAHSPPTAEQHRWGEAPIPRPFHGCLSHLTLNGQLVDLGEPPHSGGSEPGCRPQEAACSGGVGSCGYRGACVGGLNHPECQCEPGWAGVECRTPTLPSTLAQGSYMRVALSFTPPPTALTLQARVRVSGAASGILVHVTAQHHAATFTLHLRSGIVCASLTGAGMGVREACVEGRGIGDGAWHTVFGERHGHNLLVGVDDGDGWRRNETLPSLRAWRGRARGRGNGLGDTSTPPPFPPPLALVVDKHEGITVGGLPRLVGVKVVGVAEDLTEACIDDIRVSGRHLPLPPAANGTSWGQVTTARHLATGCVAPDPCLNTSCPAPLTCAATPTWDTPACSCGSGRRQVERHCEDVNECLWKPCLHGGTCTNLRPGYLCLCGPAHAGDHCQWNTHARTPSALTAPAAIAALTVSLVVLLILALVVSLRLHRHRGNLCVRERAEEEVEGGTKETMLELKPGGRGGRGRDDPGGGGGGKGRGKLALKEDVAQEKFLVRLRLKLQSRGGARSEALKERDKGSIADSSSGSSRRGSGIAGGRGGVTPPPVTPVMVTPNPTPDLARDDLRAYAYEGDGSSSGSLTSTISELKGEINAREEGETCSGRPSAIQLIPGFLEVMDLLKNLPEASSRPSPLQHPRRRVPDAPHSPPVPPPPPPPSGDALAAAAASSIVSLEPGEAKARTRIAHLSPARRKGGKEEGAEGEVSTVC